MVVCQARGQDLTPDTSNFDVDAAAQEYTGPPIDVDNREDQVLPDSLADALAEAAKATAEAIQRGSTRCQVEILMPEFWDPISGPIFPNKGDQERFWKMTRRFTEDLAAQTKIQNVRAVYPDAGVAAMLAYQWQDRSEGLRLGSLNDRRPVAQDDEMVVMACPDPPGADDAIRIVRLVSNGDEEEGREQRPIVIFNQRLSSGDVGLGLNARRLRNTFLQDFTITYSLRPIGDVATVFRRYPGMWKVFVEEPELPGRYRLIAEKPSRPQGEILDMMIRDALEPPGEANADGTPKERTFLSQLQGVVSSMSYFMKALSK